jgi:UPF0755 protein
MGAQPKPGDNARAAAAHNGPGVFSWLLAIGFALAILALSGGILALRDFAASGPLAERKLSVIEQGSGVAAIARQLETEGVIANALLFRGIARIEGADRNLQAGEYEFTPGISAAAVLAKLSTGATYQRRLTVPEGLTSAEILALVLSADGMEDLATPLPPEGSLLPETYSYSRGERPADLLNRMRTDMTRVLQEEWAARDPSVRLATPEEALILASVVEKETGLEAERPRVAGVFLNRLSRGMILQSDPTVVNGLTNGAGPLGRPLTRADIDRDTPYNTYRHIGLPPGPIANPGRASIHAVLHPETHNFLYFVADGTGGHAFAASLPEHNDNVARWRRIRAGAASPQ